MAAGIGIAWAAVVGVWEGGEEHIGVKGVAPRMDCNVFISSTTIHDKRWSKGIGW